MAECITEMIRRETFSKCPEFKYTVSIGIFSASPGPEDTLLDFIDKSDQAMYQAKANGRNQICIYSVVNSPEEDQSIEESY